MRLPIRTEAISLLLTNREDLSADLVVLEFQRRTLPYVRFNTEDFPQRATLSLGIPPDGDRLGLPKVTISSEQVRSVWYRRPVAPRPPGEQPAGSYAFASRESTAALENLWSALTCHWVSRPEQIRKATPRLAQLRLASWLGLDVLPTVLTNDTEVARAFLREPGSVVVKPIGTGEIPGDTEHPTRLAYTSRLQSDDAAELLASLSAAPVLLQRFQPKRADIRVTVVGSRVFAARIETPPDAPIDWRAVDPRDLKHIPHELPSAVESRVRKLVTSFGLAFGALDFLWTPENRYVFLEINPNGQWAWLEQELGTPIAAALVDLLAERKGPSRKRPWPG